MTSFGLAPPRESVLDELESSLRSIEPLLNTTSAKSYVSGRLLDVVTRLFQLAGSNGTGPRLERVVLLEVEADYPAIREALDLLQRAVPLAGTQDSLAMGLERAVGVLDEVEDELSDLAKWEPWLRLELVVAPIITRALMAIPRPGAAVDDLVSRVTKKLAALDGRQRSEVWARISRELAGPAPGGFAVGLPLDESIVGRSFFDLSSPDDIPAKIARYLVDHRPRLVAAATARGQQAFPMEPLALPTVLGWKEHPFTPSDTERRLARHVRFLAHLAIQRLAGQRRNLGDALGVPEAARLLGNLTEERLPSEDLSTLLIVIAECRAVAALVSKFLHAVPGFEFELLRRYKLAMEFAPRENRALLKGRNEEYCQRNLAAFLIQHGAYAVGTRFGPQETDLVTGTTLDPLIIEAKLFRKGVPPAAVIKKAIVQLREYMDKAPFRSRGVLFLFNLTEVPIFAPAELIDGRVAIVAVNLSAGTASKHVRSCEISPKPGPDLIDVLVTNVLASGKTPLTLAQSGSSPKATS